MPCVRATASPTRFTEIVSSAIISAGASTAYGLSVRPERFSLIISAQSAEGGCRPRLRKFTEATRMIASVKRMPMSAAIGETMFGSSSRRRIENVPSPRATAASTKPRTDCASVAERTMRAIAGIWMIADAEHEHALARAEARHQHEQEDERRERDQHVDRPHQQRVEQRARVPGDEADREAAGVGEQRRQAGQREHAAPAPEHARQHVAAEEVGAEPRLGARPLVRRADRLVERMRREVRPEDRDEQDERAARSRPTEAGAGAREAQPLTHCRSAASARPARRARSATMFTKM